MTDVYEINEIIRKNDKQTKLLRREISDWLYEFAPTHFISIQFPTKQRAQSMEKAYDRLKETMRYFEKLLSPRHWNRKHLEFICFAENKSSKKHWHFHIYLRNDRYDDDKITQAIHKTSKHFNYSKSVIDIKQINHTPAVAYFYGNKELKANKNGHFNSFRIMLSSEMFS